MISGLGVFPEYQRRGIGTALLAEAERRAWQRGKVRLLLGAADDTEPFYLKCGFTPRLYVEITGEKSAATLQSLLTDRLAAYNVLWSDRGEQLSKAILDVPALMPELRQSLERDVRAVTPSISSRKSAKQGVAGSRYTAPLRLIANVGE